MATKSHLKKSVAQYLWDVRQLSEEVRRHARALSRVSQGKITARTGDEMNQMADEITEIVAQRTRRFIPSTQPLIGEGLRLVNEVRVAVRYAVKVHPELAEDLSRLMPPGKQRSLAAAIMALEMVGRVLNGFAVVASLVPAGTAERARGIVRSLRATEVEAQTAREIAARVSAQYETVTLKLRRAERQCRALMGVLRVTGQLVAP